MKIFITGATGFIGQHLAKLLLAQGHELTVLIRTPSKRKLLPKNIGTVEGDLSIFEDENLTLPSFDLVIHLAGVVFAPNEAAYQKYNFDAVRHLIHCLQRQQWTLKRFIFASSLAAAGPSIKNNILTEIDIPAPIEAYGRSKLEAENFLQTINTFPTTSFRPAIVLGAGDENTLTLFQMAKWGVGINVGRQAQQLSFVSVDDLNQAIINMIQDVTKKHKVYFVAHPQEISNVTLFKTIGELLNKRVFILPLPKFLLYFAMKISTLASKTLGWKNQLDSKQYQQLTHHFVCSSRALMQDLGWQAQDDLVATLKKTIDGYRQMNKI